MAEVMKCLPLPAALARLLITMLFDSVAPLVKMSSDGSQPRSAATCSRACSIGGTALDAEAVDDEDCRISM